MADDKPSIKVLPNGPLVVRDLDRLTNSRGEPVQTKEVLSLCRCGASKKKPFCDGTHTRIGFEDALARALAHDGPALVDIVSDPELT